MLTRSRYLSYIVMGTAAIAMATAGCSPLLGSATNGAATEAQQRVGPAAAPSMLVAVISSGAASRELSQVLAATARPEENLQVVATAGHARTVVASQAPAPVSMPVHAAPAAPGSGASSYQEAQYKKAVATWKTGVAHARLSAAARTEAATAAWARGLNLTAALTSASASAAPASLPAESELAASAASALLGQAGRDVSARVVLLSASSLDGSFPVGELDGDDVIVTVPFLPTSAAASAAQANLIAAGAARAAVLGSDATQAELEQLVTEGLTHHAVTETISGRALFSNDSSALLPAASSVLIPLVAPLSRSGAIGIINGYASATGSASHNQVLSQQRAAAVASFLEAHGVPSSHLIVVGHGQANLVAPGSSAGNRRVVVVIEEATSGTV